MGVPGTSTSSGVLLSEHRRDNNACSWLTGCTDDEVVAAEEEEVDAAAAVVSEEDDDDVFLRC